jgi:small subunit ribosomal protein S8
MTNDLVSDMLTRIRNATLAKHSFARIRYSKLNIAILKVFASEGYIRAYQIEEIKPNESTDYIESVTPRTIKIFLKYKGWWIKKPLFSIIKRISKPGQRVFSGYKDFDQTIDVLRYEQGMAVISTSSGIMSHLKAQKIKKGGEILCYIG